MKCCLKRLAAKEQLSFDEIREIVSKIANDEVSDAQIGAFIMGLTNKGVSKEEFYSLAKSMRDYAIRVKSDKYIVDSCGTGADMSKSINISTTASIVANAAGANVIKQTNSSITSTCGSTDFLSALNIDINRTPEKALEFFNKNGITFVHSPYFNEFAKINNPIRQQLGIKSVFNYLGPLINASFPDAQLLGISSNEMLEKTAYALQKLGTDRALVVNGLNPNLDELSICSETRILELKNGEIEEYIIKPEDFGFRRAELSEIRGGSGIDNALLITEIFSGKRKGAMKDVISMNAGAMIYLAGIKSTLYEGIKYAEEVIENSLAAKKLSLLQSKEAVNV